MTSQFKNTEIVDTGFLQLPRGTTNERPSSPEAGQIRFNTDLGKPEWYDDSVGQWLTSDISPYVHAEGGDRVYEIQENNITYRVHEFTSVGESTFTVTRGGEVEYLIVAGGGAGGTGSGGGGGAGGLLQGKTIVTGESYNIKVGEGGNNSSHAEGSPEPGTTGVGSVALGLSTFGGGGGGISGGSANVGLPGGSGGGGGYSSTASPGSAVPGQGYPGGSGTPSGEYYATGGGGGAGQKGSDAFDSNNAGNGGSGISSNITGPLEFYAGGGGASLYESGSSAGAGGLGGGGAGSISGSGQDGISNTGGGGGGSTRDSGIGGNGGSGIVVIRYPILNTLNTSTLDLYPSAAAAYSIRRISSNSGSVIRGRRSLDNQERDFSAFEIENGKAEQFAKAQDRLPASYGDGAAAAYSLRYVRGGYTGPVVRVRRSSDNTEQDFTPTEIEDGSLESFCGSGDGLVTTWYDQSGTKNDATQTTASGQPRIVSGGVLVTENGRPALDFDGSNDFLNASSVGYTSEHTYIAVYVSDNTSKENYYFSFDYDSTNSLLVYSTYNNDQPLSQLLYRINSINNINETSFVPSEGSTVVQTITSDGSNVNSFFNGNNEFSENISVVSNTSSDLQIGWAVPRNKSTAYLEGRFSELLIYPSDQSSNREAIEENINRYYGIYEENTADLFVTTWYDQSGNGNDATQTTASAQPKIVDAGVLVTENGRASLEFNGSSTHLDTSTSIFGTPFSIFIKFNPDSPGGGREYIYYEDDSNGRPPLAYITIDSNDIGSFYEDDNDSDNSLDQFAGLSANDDFLFSFIGKDSGTADYVLNGSILGSPGIPTGSVNGERSVIGYDVNDNDGYYDGTISEMIFYKSDQSSNRESIETDINNYYGVF